MKQSKSFLINALIILAILFVYIIISDWDNFLAGLQGKPAV